MLIVPQVDFWVVFGMGKVGGTKGGRRIENWSIYGPTHVCVCVSAKFLKFYDRMAVRAKNAKSAAPSTTESAKTFMLISTHRNWGSQKLGWIGAGFSIKWKTFTVSQHGRHSVEEMFV